MELIFDIAERLDLKDLWAFQATCRTIAKQVAKTVHHANNLAGINKTVEYQNFRWRCRWARFEELACIQQADEHPKLLCSWCTDLHLASAFSPNEISKFPSERHCIGATMKLHLCRHRTFTWSQLLARQENPQGPGIIWDTPSR